MADSGSSCLLSVAIAPVSAASVGWAPRRCYMVTMKIAILETGTPPALLVARHGDYPAMVRRLLGPGHDYDTFRVVGGELPPEHSGFDAAVVTGSPAGVNDGLAWIARLEDWLRAARGRVRLIGICFGHQVIAHAFGGTVEKVPQGWGVGVHQYDLVPGGPFADRPRLAGIASHQDQVTRPPQDARTVGGTGFTPHALLAYADGSAISLQCHPEFDAGYARELLAMSRAHDLTEDRRAAGLASLDDAVDHVAMAGWIARYLVGG